MNLYDSIIEAVEEYELPANERGQLYTAVIEYLFWGREPSYKMSRAAGLCYTAMHPVFEKQRAKQQAGARGGKAKADNAKAAKQTPSKPLANDQADEKQTPTEQEQELKEEPPKGGKKKRAKFVPPSVEEVDEYLAARGLSEWLSGTEFVGYYGSQGWKKANGQPVTNWKLAASGWADRERKRKGGEYDFGSWEY